ncbi:MAG TPA: glycosyltransferase family 87 protein [Terriglobales bacterium]|nr:glycosyltransferase family 87 protein [Terriglobales bacterium]
MRLAGNVILLLTLAGIVYYFAHGFEEREKGTDFPDRYAAARMVLEGYGHQLYDFHAQEQFQIRYAGRIGEYYIHPPFGTLLFLPICFWSLKTAYLLWCILNVGVLAYTAIVFQRHVFKRFDCRVLLPLFFLFPPVLIGFLQGQDSLLLLLIMTLAVVELRRDRNFTAGCLLGCGLFKFHIVFTLIVLVASLRRKGLLRGFALVFVTLLVISVGISGWAFLTAYPRFLMSLSSLPLANIHPAAMANIRGLVSVSGVVQGTVARLALIWISSVLLLWHAWRSFKSNRSKFADATNLAFGNFVLAAILVSYHLSPSDLCIALLPIGLFSQFLAEHTGIPRWARLTLLSSQCVLFLPPLHVILLAWHGYVYLVIPILIMFLLTSAEIFKWHPTEGTGNL